MEFRSVVRRRNAADVNKMCARYNGKKLPLQTIKGKNCPASVATPRPTEFPLLLAATVPREFRFY